MINGRRIITLCGSTRFKDDFEELNAKLTLEGNIVISVGVFTKKHSTSISESQKEELDRIHKDKILLSDDIFVINRNKYIGESTRSEIEFALQNNKSVKYLEQFDILTSEEEAALLRNIDELKISLDESRAMDKSIWDLYGSELAGDFNAGSRKIERQINDIRYQLDLNTWIKKAYELEV